ncbi:MAG: alpha/beta hydrolase, partial [Pseudomonadales bacterium]
MTALFFLFAMIAGWSAYNLYRPINDHPNLCVVSFLVGWLTGELALHHIAWQVLLVFLFIWSGALEGFLAALGFLIFAASWLAMGYFYLTGERAAGTVKQALQTTLGDDYQEKINPELRARLAKGPDWGLIKLPFTSVSRRVEVIKDIEFGDHGQALDIYRPRRQLAKSPVLFQIHGGAWTRNMGSKNEQALPLMAHMAERDWICVSTDYRLCPQASFPEHMIDCKQALKWIKE